MRFIALTSLRSLTMIGLPTGLAIATLALVWFGYLATHEWEHNATQLLDKRTSEVLALLMAALNRDMKGAGVAVLVPLNERVLTSDPPNEFREACARAFARFPYPESFFLWKTRGNSGVTYFFNRADRPAIWDREGQHIDPYPVVLLEDPVPVRDLVRTARQQADHGRAFVLFEAQVDGIPYQVIAHLLYSGTHNELQGLVGFTVNMDWVRRHYFRDIIRQIARIGGEDDVMALLILDDKQQLVATNQIEKGEGPERERRFPLVFLDPDLIPALYPARPSIQYWIARVATAHGSTLPAVAAGARRTFFLMAVAALATTAGLVLTVRAVRARAQLAALQSEFVSTVTHELKTPLLSMRLVSDTLATGRYSSADTIREYAELLKQETGRLTRLIDNLLTYARLTDRRKPLVYETVDMVDLVEDTLEHFLIRLTVLGFQTTMDIPSDLPRVRVDRAAMLQVLENIVDNAIRYSGPAKVLTISARASNGVVRVEVTDRGIGIGKDEIDLVFEKFFRGR